MKRALLWVGAVIAVVALGALGWGLTGSRATASVVRVSDAKRVPTAVVEIDGRSVNTPDGQLDARVALGEHRVTVSAPGYETLRRSFTVSLFRETSLGPIRLRNAALAVRAVENFPGFSALKGAKVTVGGRPAVAADGTLVSDLPVGATAITVSAPDCIDSTLTVTLRPGGNSVTATLTPSMLSVVKRTAQMVTDRDYVLMYQILHPARQKQWGTQEQYVAYSEKQEAKAKGMVNILGFKALTPVRLAQYYDKPSKTRYSDVHRVPVSYKVSSPLLAMFGQKEMAVKETDYWLLYEGQWRTLGDGKVVKK
jgi:hypothetical protein